MTRDQHKEMFGKLEEMFWRKDCRLICILGEDPDKAAVCVTGPGVDSSEIVQTFITTVKEWNKAAARGENQD